MIKTVEIWSDKKKFEEECNNYLNAGFHLRSSNVAMNGDETGTYDICWLAIFELET